MKGLAILFLIVNIINAACCDEGLYYIEGKEIPSSSFIGKLYREKLLRYARLSETLFNIEGVETGILHNSGLLKKEHKVVLTYSHKMMHTVFEDKGNIHGILVQKGSNRNKFLIVFKGTSFMLDASRKFYKGGDSTAKDIQRANCEFLKQVRRTVLKLADMNRPILFQITGQSLGGAFAQNAAHIIKTDFPDKMNIDPKMLHVQVVTFAPAVFLDSYEDRVEFEDTVCDFGDIFHVVRHVDNQEQSRDSSIPGVTLLLNSKPPSQGLLSFFKRNHSIADLVTAIDRFDVQGFEELRKWHCENMKNYSWTNVTKAYMGCYAKKRECGHFIKGKPMCKKPMKKGDGSKGKEQPIPKIIVAQPQGPAKRLLVGTGLHGPVAKDSFIRRLRPSKIQNYLQLCFSIAIGDQASTYFSKGLLKEGRDEIVLYEYRKGNVLHAIMVRKGRHRNKFLLVFNDSFDFFDWNWQSEGQ